jgi:hypothetical protein
VAAVVWSRTALFKVEAPAVVVWSSINLPAVSEVGDT